MRGLSLDAISDYEQRRVISTPRSLEACYREGIDPLELLYRPPEDFYEEGLSPRIQELNFNLFEAKRKDSLTLARQTRMKLIESMDKTMQQSFGELKAIPKVSISTVGEKIKEKKVKALRNLVSYETTANIAVSEQLLQEQERHWAEENRKWQTLQTEKIRNEQRRLEEEREERTTQRREKTARMEAMRRFQKLKEEEERRMQREKQEQKEMALHQLESQMKIQEKIQQVEQSEEERKVKLQQKLAAELYFELERKKELKSQQEKYKQKLKARSREIEKKRKKAAEDFNKQLEERRTEFYQKKEVEDYQTSHFLHEQRVAATSMKQFAKTKDDKIARTRETAARLEEQKRLRVQRKMELSELRVQKQRQLMLEHSQFRKHINMLKQLKKDWNMRRKQRKEEYLKALSEHKLRSADEKVRQFLKAKEKIVRAKSAVNRALDLEQFQLHEAIQSMALTKKWEQGVVDELTRGSVDLTSTAPDTVVRPRTAKAGASG